jgi:glutamine synthetase
MLTDIVDQMEQGKLHSSKTGGVLSLGGGTLPDIQRDAGDRNRTSPFAFTGNKFEFRAVGASGSISWPVTVLNTIAADALDYLATELEKATAGKQRGPDFDEAVLNVLQGAIKDHRRVIFNGDNYEESWHKEAERRGLPHLRDVVDALPIVQAPEKVEMFERTGVLSKDETTSRTSIFLERWIKQLTIEAETMLSMARTIVIPAALRYQREVGEAVAACEGAGVDPGEERGLLEEIVELTNRLRTATRELDEAVGHHDEDHVAHARFIKDNVVARMERVRETADELERIVADSLWPLPTYREMLSIK